MTRSFKGIPGPASRDRPGSFDLYHEPQTERDLVAVSLVELDAIHTVSMSGALGLGTVAVGVEICHGYGIKIGGISDLSRFLTGWDGRTILYFLQGRSFLYSFTRFSDRPRFPHIREGEIHHPGQVLHRHLKLIPDPPRTEEYHILPLGG